MVAPARFREAGFSLLELVITMVLTALLAVLAMQPVVRALQARSRVAGNLAAIDALRFATERMVRELRQVRYDAQGSGFQLAALDPIAGISSASGGLCFTRVGGNAGTTVGEQRLIAYRKALQLWGETLKSDVTIVVQERDGHAERA